MGELILETDYQWQPGCLYYCKADANGKVCVYEAKMARGGRHKVKKKGE